MSTANQLYKASGSELPFKEWLKREQLKGQLDVHENNYINANGGETAPASSSPCGGNTLLYLAIGLAAGFVLCKVISKKQE
jgi:hypothetical protein